MTSLDWTGDQVIPTREDRANYLRDIIGNPFIGDKQ